MMVSLARVNRLPTATTPRQERRTNSTVPAHNGFMGQGPAEIIFGLGEATAIDRLEVRWPSGRTQVYQNLAANQYFLLKEKTR